MRRDYYAVLGLAATAGSREIGQAYQRLARQCSPDVNFWDEEARALLTEIAEAYRVLSDPAARAMYDRFGHRMGGDALEAGRRGEDVQVAVELSFAEAARGATFELEVPRFSPCGACGATGVSAGDPCPVCLGRGVRRAVDVVSVTIPAGVDSGTQVRVRGEGDAAPFGGPRGDLIVSTRVREHAFFRRQGEGVYCEVPISVWEALRGARIHLPPPTGEAGSGVPPATTAGRQCRLCGDTLATPGTGGGGGVFLTHPAGRAPRGGRRGRRVVPAN